ncbi:MAG: hypothetical protein ABFS86_02335 [Planctomycetota bacterium]
MRTLGLLLALTLVCTACASPSEDAAAPDADVPGPDGQWDREIVAYHKAVSASQGIVGWVKVFEYTRPDSSSSHRLFHVYDRGFQERGFVTEKGTGTKYVQLPSSVAEVKGYEVEKIPLPAQPLAWNVAQILDVPTDLRIVKASQGDVKK